MNPPPLPVRVAESIRDLTPVRPGDTVIVGLSGGMDSCALLALLSSLPRFPLRLIAAHLNHCLRGSESDADEAFCRSLAQQHTILFESRRTDVTYLAAENRLSLEEAGREARLTYFNELMEKHGAKALALAHHRDDQAETFLMRLLRGSGVDGLCGMSSFSRGCYIRPLLGVSRSEIEAYMHEHNLNWREDSSNRDTVFLRNRLRHELIPALEQYNPNIKERLAITTGILARDNELLSKLAQQEYDRLALALDGAVRFDAGRLKELHPALSSRVVRIALMKQAGSLRNFSSGHIADVSALLEDGPPNRSINLPGAVTVRREYEIITFSTSTHTGEDLKPISITGPGKYQLWDNSILVISVSLAPDKIEDTPDTTSYIDTAKAPFPWTVRTFLPGDRIVPFGMTGRKKIKDICIDMKIPMTRRRRIPLIFSNEILIWACGLCLSADVSISGESSSIAKAVLIKQSPCQP